MMKSTNRSIMLKNAFIDASLQIADKQIVGINKPIEVSSRHQKRMQKLLKRANKFYWPIVNTKRKCIALLLVVLLILMLAGCTVWVYFVKPSLSVQSGTRTDQTGDIAYLLFSSDIDIPLEHFPTTIQKEYTFSSLPSGFVLTQKQYSHDNQSLTTCWESTNGQRIVLVQYTLNNLDLAVDIGDAPIFNIQLNSENIATCWKKEGMISALWINGEYFYILEAPNISDDELKALLISLK